MKRTSRNEVSERLGASHNLALENLADKNIRAPRFLPPRAREIFYELVAQLQQLGRLIAGDSYTVAVLAKSIYDWEKLIELNEKRDFVNIDTNGKEGISATYKEERALRRAILRMCEQLGLSPRARQFARVSSDELVDVDEILERLTERDESDVN